MRRVKEYAVGRHDERAAAAFFKAERAAWVRTQRAQASTERHEKKPTEDAVQRYGVVLDYAKMLALTKTDREVC